jgi:hypothetical protein
MTEKASSQASETPSLQRGIIRLLANDVPFLHVWKLRQNALMTVKLWGFGMLITRLKGSNFTPNLFYAKTANS